MKPFRIFDLLTEWRARRDERSWRDFESAIVRASASADTRFGQVVKIRQIAKTGTKAYMRWVGQDAADAIKVETEERALVMRARSRPGGHYDLADEAPSHRRGHSCVLALVALSVHEKLIKFANSQEQSISATVRNLLILRLR